MISDRCTSKFCKNGGQCEIDGDKLICKCPDEFTGDTCEIGLFKKFFSKVARTSQSKVNNFDQISQTHKKINFHNKTKYSF